uniref:Uncharacterized protein n=1 Tax=Glossina palpalis gambiensis TaxID=67801 RepID=A0A1B0BDB2_9MUSC
MLMDNNANDETGNSDSSATIRNCDNNATNTLTQSNNSLNIANANGDECRNEAKESDDEEENSTIFTYICRLLCASRYDDMNTLNLSLPMPYQPFCYPLDRLLLETLMLVKQCVSKLNFPNIFFIQRPHAHIKNRFNSRKNSQPTGVKHQNANSSQ